MKEILPNVHMLHLGGVNAYLIDHGSLTLIDTGYPNSTNKILGYVKRIGKKAEDIDQIILTHLHVDHVGSAAEIGKLSKANIIMHEEDATLVSLGIAFREEHVEISPGLLNNFIFRLFIKNISKKIPSFPITQSVTGGEKLKIGPGMSIIHLPGHTKGQIALLYHISEGILFGADTSANFLNLNIFPFYENYQQGLMDLQTLAKLEFNSLCLGHGKPILKDAKQVFHYRMKKYL